jgi:hypothetical protein
LILGINLIYYCAQALLPITSYESPLLGLQVTGTDRSREIASEFVFWGLLSFSVVGLAFPPPSRPASNQYQISPTSTWIALSISLLLSLSVLGLNVNVESQSFIYIPTIVANFASAILLIRYFLGKLSNLGTWALAAIVSLIVLAAIASGLVARVIHIALLIFFISIAVRRRFPNFGVLLLVFASVFTLLMFKGIYRELYWLDVSRGGGIGFIESVQNFFTFFYGVSVQLDSSTAIDLLNAAALRIGMFHIFDYAASWTPDYIPFWSGDSYIPVLYKLIPRFLFESKPLEDMGQTFGHAYYFLEQYDYHSSVNLPLLVEMYLNFGFIGAPIGMSILAAINIVVFRLIDTLLKTMEARLAAKAVVFVQVANIESNFSLVYGGIPLVLMLFWVCEMAMASRVVNRTPRSNPSVMTLV